MLDVVHGRRTQRVKTDQVRMKQFKVDALLLALGLLICAISFAEPRPAQNTRQGKGLLNALFGKKSGNGGRYAGRFSDDDDDEFSSRQEFDYEDDGDTGPRRPANSLDEVPVDAPEGTQNVAQTGYFYYVPASDWDGDVSTFERIRAYDLPIRADELQAICDEVPAAYCPNSFPWLRSAFIRTVVFSFLNDVLADFSR